MDHRAIEIDELQDAEFEYNAAGSAAGSIGGDQLELMTKWKPFMANGLASPPRNYDEAGPGHAPAGSRNETVTYCLARVRRRLGERERRFRAGTSSCTIFRIPPTLCGINPKAEQPEIVSIGPYHRGRDHLLEFEEHKWFFLRRFLHRTSSNEASLIELLAAEENSVRTSYSETVLMSSGDFVEMMLLDGCFVLELLLHIFRSDDPIDEDDPIFTRPWIIPILIRDLLKLENQVPYFLLKSLFDFSSSTRVEAKTDYLCTLALRVFDLAYPRPVALLKDYENLQCKHLLDLFYLTLFPTNPDPCNYPQMSRPSDQSVPCVTSLRPSGIKFKSKKTHDFLDISFRKRVLEIPSITINDFTTTVLVNCVALEQYKENSSKHITDYVSFMHCLINQPKDVSLLCSDGIITRFSHDDQYVANFFNKLGKSTVFNVHGCYLSKQFEELESYYYSNWANMMRTYFSSPWSVISVFSAFLVIVLTVIQTVFAVLGYRFH
ncbi:UPF0481 protein At3g47200 [Eucalyptus grandis]|uniref:UPF0481 protein At3g47200 n=1 Tax=Eucalyptus grandis TaxID=71139 RepID=UPI00192ECE65|nr:UPF0481 protein At3g47200 [Eucalyptus grandis]